MTEKTTKLAIPVDTLGGRIAQAREAAGFDPREAARRLGVLTSTWKGWESGKAKPRANRVFMMAGVLGVSPGWLLSGQGDEPVDRSDPERAELLTGQLKSALADAASSQQRILELGRKLHAKSMT